MTELKTLKDIEFGIDEDGCETDWLVNIDDLRKEAIKWVRDYKKEEEEHQNDNEYICQISRITDWIRHFFNLTEEEFI